MPMTFTAISRVRDWQKLREAYHASLLSRARQAGARSLWILRDLHDASQALVIAELPDQDAACELRLALEEHMGPVLADGPPDTRVWEATGWEAIGDPGACAGRS